MLVFDHWIFVLNCSSAVSLVFLNKLLLSQSCAFRSIGFLAALHSGVTYIFAVQQAPDISLNTAKLRRLEVLILTVLSISSIIFQNVSLLCNDVGVYQLSKIAVIPLCCVLEYFAQGRRVSVGVACAISLLIAGVIVACVCVVRDAV